MQPASPQGELQAMAAPIASATLDFRSFALASALLFAVWFGGITVGVITESLLGTGLFFETVLKSALCVWVYMTVAQPRMNNPSQDLGLIHCARESRYLVFSIGVLALTILAIMLHSNQLSHWAWVDLKWNFSWHDIALLSNRALFMPIAEELFFRGLLLRCLLHYCSSFVPVSVLILAQSILFVAAHAMSNELGLNLRTAQIFFMGIGFGILVWATGSLLLAILVHIAWNTLPTLILGLLPAAPEANTLFDGQSQAVVSASFAVAAVAWVLGLILMTRNKHRVLPSAA